MCNDESASHCPWLHHCKKKTFKSKVVFPRKKHLHFSSLIFLPSPFFIHVWSIFRMRYIFLLWRRRRQQEKIKSSEWVSLSLPVSLFFLSDCYKLSLVQLQYFFKRMNVFWVTTHVNIFFLSRGGINAAVEQCSGIGCSWQDHQSSNIFPELSLLSIFSRIFLQPKKMKLCLHLCHWQSETNRRVAFIWSIMTMQCYHFLARTKYSKKWLFPSELCSCSLCGHNVQQKM